MKNKSLSYVELSENGCSSIVLENLRMREKVYGGARALTLGEADSKKLATTIIELFKTVAIKQKTLYRTHKEYKKMDYLMTMTYRGAASQHNYIVPTDFVLSFVAMYDMMAAATKNIYGIGMDKGKNLLIGLNDGTYTIKDFNEESKHEED